MTCRKVPHRQTKHLRFLWRVGDASSVSHIARDVGGFGYSDGSHAMMMDVATDRQNILEKTFLVTGDQENGGKMTENSPHVPNMTPTNTPSGQPDNAPMDEKPTSPTVSPTPKKPPIRNLQLLLDRENVDWIHVVRSKKIRVAADFPGDEKDTKTYVLGDDKTGGCIVILHLSDNPMGVDSDKFYECSPVDAPHK